MRTENALCFLMGLGFGNFEYCAYLNKNRCRLYIDHLSFCFLKYLQFRYPYRFTAMPGIPFESTRSMGANTKKHGALKTRPGMVIEVKQAGGIQTQAS